MLCNKDHVLLIFSEELKTNDRDRDIALSKAPKEDIAFIHELNSFNRELIAMSRDRRLEAVEIAGGMVKDPWGAHHLPLYEGSLSETTPELGKKEKAKLIDRSFINEVLRLNRAFELTPERMKLAGISFHIKKLEEAMALHHKRMADTK